MVINTMVMVVDGLLASVCPRSSVRDMLYSRLFRIHFFHPVRLFRNLPSRPSAIGLFPVNETTIPHGSTMDSE